MANTSYQGTLGKVGKLPKQITDVTHSIGNGATKVHNMTTKIDAALKKIPTYNTVSGAVIGGLSKTAGALDNVAAKAENAAKAIEAAGTRVATAITPIATAAASLNQSLTDLQNCKEVLNASSLVVDAVVNSVTGHFHPRANEQAFNKFDTTWDSWARVVNTTYENLSPTKQKDILETLARANFGDNVYALGSAIKNESAGIFGGIADFEDSLHAFRGTYRNPVEAAKKIETGVKGIINATERVANSVNNMIKTYQDKTGATVKGNPILAYIGNLHNTKAVSAINKTLTVGGGTATLWTDGVAVKNAIKSGDLKSIYSTGKKTFDDAKTIIKGLKDNDAATKVTTLAKNDTSSSQAAKSLVGSNASQGGATGGAAPIQSSNTGSQQQTSGNPQDSSKTSNSQNNSQNNNPKGGGGNSYVCSGATMKCTMGTSQAKLTVLPDRVTDLTGKPQANISDHKSFVNLAPFGRCRSMGFPATASATAAAQGTLTPMPCMHNTPIPWMGGKLDYLIKGQPALLKSCKCQCMWGGTISLVTDGQTPTGPADLSKMPLEFFNKNQKKKELTFLDGVQENNSPYITGNGDFSPLAEAENHLRILKTINKENLKDFPQRWVQEWNKAIKNVNEKYNSEGIASVYSDVEHLYNMYQLTSSEDAKMYGLRKLSDKTPYQVFDIDKQIPGFVDRMPSRKFWDTFDTYVPLYTNTGTGAYFSPSYGYVVIPMTENSVNRMSNSEWYQAGRFYHEYGHAYDHMKGWRNDQEFKDVFADFKSEMERSNIIDKVEEYIDRRGGTSQMTEDEKERLGSLTDSLQAASSDHEFISPRGHDQSYYASEDLQMAEFIAHMSESYWGGNDMFETFAPESYQKMRDLLSKRWR